MFVLPPRLLDRLPRGALVVEVGVGGRFDALEALAGTRPDLQLRAVDVNAHALRGSPEAVHAVQDDVWEPTLGLYEGASLLFAIRCPSELQPPLARLSRRVGALVAFTVVKDEWAPLGPILGDHDLVRHEGRSWRIHEA